MKYQIVAHIEIWFQIAHVVKSMNYVKIDNLNYFKNNNNNYVINELLMAMIPNIT